MSNSLIVKFDLEHITSDLIVFILQLHVLIIHLELQRKMSPSERFRGGPRVVMGLCKSK